MIEVELKAIVNDVQKIKKILESFAEVERPYQKKDIYFKKDDFIVRLREDIENIVTFKKKVIEDGVEVSEENEFVVGDPTVFIKFLHLSGFKEYYHKNKNGCSYKYDELTFDLSLVNNLGWYLEIEKLVGKKDDIENAKKQIMKMLKRVGLENNIESRTYEQLILNTK